MLLVSGIIGIHYKYDYKEYSAKITLPQETSNKTEIDFEHKEYLKNLEKRICDLEKFSPAVLTFYTTMTTIGIAIVLAFLNKFIN
ncbi:MAG: hypothetical protein KC733_07335 [Candidatus Omnitrophica bacterium]|nr:hypothetical protein [Candidatus Omnitrophota bacterium]